MAGKSRNQHEYLGSEDADADGNEDSFSSEDMQKTVMYMKHLEWHCAVYREALSNVSHSTKLLEKAKAKFLQAGNEENCQSCHIEDLKEKINQLQVQLQNKTNVNKWISKNDIKNKRSKQ